MKRFVEQTITVLVLTISLAALPASASSAASTRDGAPTLSAPFSARSAKLVAHGVSSPVCATAQPVGFARCDLVVRRDPAVSSLAPQGESIATPAALLGDNGAYSPAYLQSAYDARTLGQATNAGAGRIVAVVDAYANPALFSDLNYYRSYFGLPACVAGTVAASNTGCVFQQVNENGQASPIPATNTGWGLETATDVEMVSALCVNCQILVVEAQSPSMTDLGTAVNTAVTLGANVVSNSYGSSEWTSEVGLASTYFNHPGVAIVAAAGDNGYGVQFPAAAPSVIAVGGTTLLQTSKSGTRAGSETVWAGSGSGCSAFEPKPAWQHDTLCARRSLNDVAAVADPNTGVWVYDASSGSQMSVAGGTSVATAVVSALYALAGGTWSANESPARTLYASASSLYQVTSGANGTCGTYLCDASQTQNGYNGPTGIGTFGASPSSLPALVPATNAATVPASSSPAATLGVPSAPSNVIALPGNAAVTVGWAAPSNVGGSAITSYVVSDAQAHSCTDVVSAAATNSCTVTGLTNGTPERFSVVAINASGQSTASTPTSSVVPAPSLGVRQLSVGHDYGCAVLSTGQVDCWGANTSGQLGNGTFTTLSTLSPVLGLRNAVQVATGAQSSCAVTSTGSVYCWGANTSGQLGNGATVNLPAPTLVQGVTKAIQVSVGTNYACAVTSAGLVQCWGDNSMGQLGTGTTTQSSSAVQAKGVTGATAVQASFNHTCALQSGGTVSCWGANTSGQLGSAASAVVAIPQVVASINDVTQLSLGYANTCALLGDGSVWCWGYNGDGELGLSGLQVSSAPLQVQGLPAISLLSSGAYGSCATDRSGAVWCWGYEAASALTANVESNAFVPTTMSQLSSVQLLSSAYSNDFSCAVLSSGALVCWSSASPTPSVVAGSSARVVITVASRPAITVTRHHKGHRASRKIKVGRR